MDIPAHAGTVHDGLSQTRLEEDLRWSVPHASPHPPTPLHPTTQLAEGLNWKCVTCSMLSGSFSVTGMEILVRSFPMFLYSRFHRLMSGVSGLATGSLLRRPVAHSAWDGSSVTVQQIIPVIFGCKLFSNTDIWIWMKAKFRQADAKLSSMSRKLLSMRVKNTNEFNECIVQVCMLFASALLRFIRILFWRLIFFFFN